jgi:hypothetical protein
MIKKIVGVFILMIVILSCTKPVQKQQKNVAKSELQGWKLEVQKTLKLFGHRNWIVIETVLTRNKAIMESKR